MLKERIKKYPKTVVCAQESRARLARLEREIKELDAKISRGEAQYRSEKSLVLTRCLKEERRRVEEDILARLEGEMLAVEKVLTKAVSDLMPLELIIITKLYVDGIRWNELLETLQNDPAYRQFCYERSTYMRAHRTALDKLVKAEAEDNAECATNRP